MLSGQVFSEIIKNSQSPCRLNKIGVSNCGTAYGNTTVRESP